MNATILKEKIADKGIKKKWLASQLNVSPPMISYWLGGSLDIPDKHKEKLQKLLA